MLRVQRVHLALELEQLYFETDLVHQRFVYHLTHCLVGQQLIQIVPVLHLLERSDMSVDGLLDRTLLRRRAAALRLGRECILLALFAAATYGFVITALCLLF